MTVKNGSYLASLKTKNILILVLIFLGCYYIIYTKIKSAAITVEASLACAQEDENKKCQRWADPELFSLALHLQTGSCSVMHQSSLDKTVTFRTSQLAYINDDNWECRDQPIAPGLPNPSKGTQMVYQMLHGTLSIFSEDLDHVVGIVEYQHLQRKSGFDSWIRH